MNKFELIIPVDAVHYEEFIHNHITWTQIFPLDIPICLVYDQEVVPSQKDIIFTNVKFSKLVKTAVSSRVKMFSVFAEPFLYSDAEYFVKFDTDNILGRSEYDLLKNFGPNLDWQSQTINKIDEPKFHSLSTYYDIQVRVKTPRPLTNILIYKNTWIKKMCDKTKFSILPINSFSIWFWWCTLGFGAKYQLVNYPDLFDIRHKNISKTVSIP